MKAEAFSSWQVWALLSAIFAALTAIFAKVGVENINPDLATFIRTIVVLVSFALLLFATGQFVAPNAVSPKTWMFSRAVGSGDRRIMALLFSRAQARIRPRWWRRSTS